MMVNGVEEGKPKKKRDRWSDFSEVFFFLPSARHPGELRWATQGETRQLKKNLLRRAGTLLLGSGTVGQPANQRSLSTGQGNKAGEADLGYNNYIKLLNFVFRMKSYFMFYSLFFRYFNRFSARLCID